MNHASPLELRVCAEFLRDNGWPIETLEEGLLHTGTSMAPRDDATHLLANGAAAALHDIARNLLQEHPERFATANYLEEIRPFRFHLCPKCDGNLRTSEAKQCFNCGYDWHSGPVHELRWDGMDYAEPSGG